MKKKIKNNLFGFILGIILCSGIVYGVNLYNATDISYNNNKTNVENVNEALNDLYDIVNVEDAQYKIDITITCYFSGYDGYSIEGYAKNDGAKSTRTHTIYVRSLDDVSYENLELGTIYGGGHRNGNPTTGTPAAFYVIDDISITKLT